MSQFIYPPLTVSISGGATEAKQDVMIAELQEINEKAQSETLFTTYHDFSVTNLPGNATNPLELVASTSLDITEIQIADTGGNFMEIMTGAAASEVRICVVGPGSDSITKITVAAGTRLSVRRLDSASAAAVGALAINYIG